MFIRFLSVLIFLLIICFGCSGNEDRPDRTDKTHPTQENIPENIDFEISGDSSEMLDNIPVFRKLANQDYSTVFTVGADTQGDDFLGEVEDVVFTDDDKILILDSAQYEIKIYDLDGNLVNSFGREGKGPGEFLSPEGMVLSSNNKLIVIDRYNKINIYDYSDATIEYVNTIQLNFVPEDICTLNDRFIVRGVQQPDQQLNANILHVYSLDNGEPLQSFGASYKSDHWLVVNQLSDGPIACNEKNDSIAIMYEYFPYLYSYNLDGDLNWASEIEDFNGLEVEESYRDGNTTPAVSFTQVNDGGEVGYSLQQITHDGEEIIVLQTRKNSSQKYIFSTYVLSSSKNAGTYLGDELPIIYAKNQNLFIIEGETDYPSIKLIALNNE